MWTSTTEGGRGRGRRRGQSGRPRSVQKRSARRLRSGTAAWVRVVAPLKTATLHVWPARRCPQRASPPYPHFPVHARTTVLLQQRVRFRSACTLQGAVRAFLADRAFGRYRDHRLRMLRASVAARRISRSLRLALRRLNEQRERDARASELRQIHTARGRAYVSCSGRKDDGTLTPRSALSLAVPCSGVDARALGAVAAAAAGLGRSLARRLRRAAGGRNRGRAGRGQRSRPAPSGATWPARGS